jgi:hypothetical protein
MMDRIRLFMFQFPRASLEIAGRRRRISPELGRLEFRFAGVADDRGAGRVAEADKFVPV